MEQNKELDNLAYIFNMCKNFLIDKDFTGLKVFINNLPDKYEIGVLKMILLVTKAFKDHRDFSSYRAVLYHDYKIVFDKMMAEIEAEKKKEDPA